MTDLSSRAPDGAEDARQVDVAKSAQTTGGAVEPKRDHRFDYWQECVSNAAEECQAALTPEQIEWIAGACEGAHENYGMAFYQPSANDHYASQIDSLKRELKTEKSKVHCETCNGRGRIYSQGPYHGSDSGCWKCNGEGKVLP